MHQLLLVWPSLRCTGDTSYSATNRPTRKGKTLCLDTEQIQVTRRGKTLPCSRTNQAQETLKGKTLPCSRLNQTQDFLQGKTLPCSRTNPARPTLIDAKSSPISPKLRKGGAVCGLLSVWLSDPKKYFVSNFSTLLKQINLRTEDVNMGPRTGILYLYMHYIYIDFYPFSNQIKSKLLFTGALARWCNFITNLSPIMRIEEGSNLSKLYCNANLHGVTDFLKLSTPSGPHGWYKICGLLPKSCRAPYLKEMRIESGQCSDSRKCARFPRLLWLVSKTPHTLRSSGDLRVHCQGVTSLPTSLGTEANIIPHQAHHMIIFSHTKIKIKIKILILTAHTPAAVKMSLSHSTSNIELCTQVTCISSGILGPFQSLDPSWDGSWNGARCQPKVETIG
eukprot:sb/3465496/